MYLPRLVSQQLTALFAHFPVVVVSGARQVGKSTLLAHVFGAQAQTVVFDPVIDIRGARAEPELFLDNHRTPLILDEIQYAPELVTVIKRRVDQDRRPGQYLLTGSQQWGVLRQISESLAGRAVFLDLEGFCLLELAERTASASWLQRWLSDPEAFVAAASHPVLALGRSVTEQLWRGFLPEAQTLPLPMLAPFFAGYLRTYIERDLRLLADVADVQLFGRFVRLVTALTAQEINYSQLGRELGVAATTAHRWLDILRATFQWYELPPFVGNAIKRVSGKRKGYVADTGLACALQVIPQPQALLGHPRWGALFETAVVAEVRKLAAVLQPPPTMYHWRAASGAEVDLLLEYNGQLFPIEVKGSHRPTGHDTRGIQALRRQQPQQRVAPGLIIAPTPHFQRLSADDYALPWHAL